MVMSKEDKIKYPIYNGDKILEIIRNFNYRNRMEYE